MTSHVCGHLHHWRAVSTLRWCDRRQVACLRALVGNCLRPDDASMSEWKYECLYGIFGNSSVVQCILFVHHFCYLPTGNFWIQLFFPHCHIQSGKKCWEPMFSIVRLIKITSDSLDSIPVLHRSHWSHFHDGFMQILCRFCLCTIPLFELLFVRTWYYRRLGIAFDTNSFSGNLMCVWRFVCLRKRVLSLSCHSCRGSEQIVLLNMNFKQVLVYFCEITQIFE